MLYASHVPRRIVPGNQTASRSKSRHVSCQGVLHQGMKKSTMDPSWVPGVNNLRQHGRWAFAEFSEVYQIASDFKAKVEGEFNKMIQKAGQS
jgi:hypothetical protein